MLDALGLAGNLETARLMEQIGAGETAAALETLSRLYGAGKEVGSLLGELSALARDLLIRRTAPQGGAALLTGGYDETTLRKLSNAFQTQRLAQMLGLLQGAIADLSRSSNRRTDAELCLIRLCDPTLDESAAGLNARLSRVEALLAGGIPTACAVPGSPAAPPGRPPKRPRRRSPLRAETGGPVRPGRRSARPGRKRRERRDRSRRPRPRPRGPCVRPQPCRPLPRRCAATSGPDWWPRCGERSPWGSIPS